MRFSRLPAFLLVLSPTVVTAQQAIPPLVEVVNLPEVQVVTGDELRASRDALALLSLRTTGALPAGLAAPQVEECLVIGLSEYFESEVVRIQDGPSGCTIRAYADACKEAAGRHRYRCRETCEEFRVLGGDRSCRGNDRPTIEPFSRRKHCRSDAEGGATLTCFVTGWCSCDP